MPYRSSLDESVLERSESGVPHLLVILAAWLRYDGSVLRKVFKA